MRLNKNIQTSAIVFISLLASSVAEARPVKYTFEKMADTNGSFKNFGTPVINNVGKVAFTADEDAGGSGLFTTSDGTTVTNVANQRSLTSIGDISLNDSGVVAFIGIPADSDAAQFQKRVYTGKGTTISAIAHLPQSFAAPCCSVAINNSGVVAFVAVNPRYTAIATSDGRTLAVSGETRVSAVDSVDINDKGTVVYRLQSNYNFAIYANNGKTPDSSTRVFDTSYPLFIGGINYQTPGVNSPSVNNQGIVAFFNIPQAEPSTSSVTRLDRNKAVLLKSDGKTTTTVADTKGVFSSLGTYRGFDNSFTPPSINDRGVVAFVASLKSGGEGIFIGSDPLNDKIIATGDSLFGYTVQSVELSEEGLNNAGQIVFRARLGNNSEVVVRATPKRRFR